MRISTTVFAGRWTTFMPRRRPFTLCVGTPIPVKQCAEVAEVDAEVARVHTLYKKALSELYDAHKDECGYAGRTLVFRCEEPPKKAKAI